MSRTPSLVRRTAPVLATVALLGAGGLAWAGPAEAAGSPAAGSPTAAPAGSTATTSTVTTASLLTIEDVRAAGLDADSAVVTRTGDAQLNDGGHWDENCLIDKTIRAITGAKSYPDRGTGKGYADGDWTSTQDKEVFVSESVAQGRTTKDTDRYVAVLKQQTTDVAQCQQDPAQGIRHAPARRVDGGDGSTAVYYATVYPDGSRDGGGVAIVRDGTRFGIVSVGSGRDHTAYTLERLTRSAAQRLR